jgi:hypothetical protein
MSAPLLIVYISRRPFKLDLDRRFSQFIISPMERNVFSNVRLLKRTIEVIGCHMNFDALETALAAAKIGAFQGAARPVSN